MSLEVIETWRALLGEVGELGDTLCMAIEADDVLAAIATMMQLRHVRSTLARVEAPVRVRGELAELQAMREIMPQMIRARGAEAAMQRWLERTLPGDPRLLASPLGCATLADSILPPVWDFDIDLVVLVGPGLDPVAQILGDLGQRRIVMLGAKTPVAAAVHIESIDELATAVRTLVPNPPTQLVIRGAQSVAREELERTMEVARNASSDLRIHRNTVRAFSRTWIEQGLANLDALAHWPSVAALDGALAKVPMVIVAPGPSLAKNVDQLRALKGRAIVTAFSHSLKPVLAAGVVPDLVVTVDPQDVRYHFADCDLSRTCLVNAATVHPALFELPAARCLTLSANCAIDDWIFDGLGEGALVPGGGSVATTAFSLALRWGCDPIVFVGLDLSFPGGEYYVATSSDGRARAHVDDHGVMRVEGWSSGFAAMKARGGPEAATERAVELAAWGGGSVRSSFMFALFHRWFVDRMKHVAATTVYNCTEGGAYIDGMQHVPLARVAPSLDTSIDITEVIQGVAVDREARTRRLTDHLRGFVAGLRRCRALARVARRLIERGETGPRLERVERALAVTLRPLEFASLLAQREVERAHDVARRAGSTMEFLGASSRLLATLDGVVDQLEPALASAIDRLASRGREHGHAA